MPELPEVETVKNKISPHLIGKTIRDVKVFYSKYSLLSSIKNQKIEAIDRKGKFLIFTLTDYYLISHLRMEGKYMIKENPSRTKHDLVFFEFDDFTLIYNDTRKFGVFYLFTKDINPYQVYPLSSVGPEPFTISSDYLISKLKDKSGHIKTLLLDQSIMSGLGNIYVDEVLFMSKISPFKPGKDITKEEVDQIIANSINVLSRAIKAGGTTVRSFSSFNGESGHFQGSLLVHEQEGKKCPICGNIIIKTKVNGRGTFLCPSCQRNRNYKIYAITGTFASGKSTVLKILASKGFETLSADDIYHELLESSSKLKKEMIKKLGTCTLGELRDLVFSDLKKNEELKEITHKYVMREIFEKAEASNNTPIFVEVPLLFEGHFEKAFDASIDVFESDEVESDILKARRITKEYREKVNALQLSKEEKRKRADFVVWNIGSVEDLDSEVNKLLKEIDL